MTEQARDMDSLLSAHRAEVHGLLRAITRDPATAEDLTQEVFLLAFRKKVRPGAGMRQWLRRVARNLAMNGLRKKRPVLLAAEDLERAAESVSSKANEQLPEFSEELAALRKCMQELKPPDGQILAERYEEGRSLSQIAAQVKQSVGYIKQRMFRLRRRLAECIKRRIEAGHA